MNSVVAIVGPTAVGKSSLALDLSNKFSGEIINADSRQVYRYMDIGTAKPTPEEQAQVPHHLIDIVFPDQEFNLALYQAEAKEAIEDIQNRGKLPILVGGSGLYVWAVLEGWLIPPVSPDYSVRRRLEATAELEGVETIYEELIQVDPAAAQQIDPRNARRIIRALEVSRQGRPFSQLKKKEPFVDALVIGLTIERADLYKRIDTRVDRMIEKGLVHEVEGLVSKGYGFDLPAMSGLGYKQIGMFLQGMIKLTEAVEKIKFDTHRFARHQYNWFRLHDERIHWFETHKGVGKGVQDLVHRFSSNWSNHRLEN